MPIDKKTIPEKVIDKVFVQDHNYDIIGMVNGFYIVKTNNGLKRVKIGSNKKRVGDKIRIDKL